MSQQIIYKSTETFNWKWLKIGSQY